jgi:hypothetical protein
MQRAFLLTISRAAVTAGLLTATPAFAHIDLVEPEARAHGTAASGDTAVDTNANQKSGPCGQVTNGRGSRVTTYAPGETITIRVREETPHDSYIRVSIDMDGDTFPQRPVMATPAETQEVALAAEEALPGADDTLLSVVRESNNMANFEHEIEVELPDETCTSCTLQVIQFMYGAPNPFYFQCADIVIAEDGGGAGGSAGAANSGSAGAGGAAGSSMIAVTTGGGSGIISAGGAAMATGGAAGAASTSSAGSSSTDDEDEPADDEGGCTLPATPGRSGAMGLLSLFALALGLVRRRR